MSLTETSRVPHRGERFTPQGNHIGCRFGQMNKPRSQYQIIQLELGELINTNKGRLHEVLIECPALNDECECPHGGYCQQIRYEGTKVAPKKRGD